METERKLLRPYEGRVIAGVCAAVARYFSVDVTLVRVIVAVLAIPSCGIVIPAYLICWILIPVE